MKKKILLASLTLASLFSQANAALVYDADVTSNAIFGGGNVNGSFTVLREQGIELGLRGKLRHNAVGAPENTFNSNGDGTYSFDAGSAFGQAANVANWSFEWSVNTNYDGTTGNNLVDYTYELLLDTDPTFAQSFISFDPITAVASPTNPFGWWDHSIGDNSTAQGAGIEATSAAEYGTLLANNNLAQNSWKPHWYNAGLDPTVDGVYTISLAISDAQGQFIGSTDIDIIVGAGATAVPEPAMLGLLGLGFLSLAYRSKKTR